MLVHRCDNCGAIFEHVLFDYIDVPGTPWTVRPDFIRRGKLSSMVDVCKPCQLNLLRRLT